MQTNGAPAGDSPSRARDIRNVLARTNEPSEELSTTNFLTVDETATLFRVSRETVRRMVHQGRLAALVLGSGQQAQIRVPRAFVDRVLAEVAAGRTVVMAELAAAWGAEHNPPQADQ